MYCTVKVTGIGVKVVSDRPFSKGAAPLCRFLNRNNAPVYRKIPKMRPPVVKYLKLREKGVVTIGGRIIYI